MKTAHNVVEIVASSNAYILRQQRNSMAATNHSATACSLLLTLSSSQATPALWPLLVLCRSVPGWNKLLLVVNYLPTSRSKNDVPGERATYPAGRKRDPHGRSKRSRVGRA